MMRDLNWFRSLRRRDFDNGAILDEIEAVFRNHDNLAKAVDELMTERDRLLGALERCRIRLGGHPDHPDHWPVAYSPFTGIGG
jgi:hypothetical protein